MTCKLTKNLSKSKLNVDMGKEERVEDGVMIQKKKKVKTTNLLEVKMISRAKTS